MLVVSSLFWFQNNKQFYIGSFTEIAKSNIFKYQQGSVYLYRILNCLITFTQNKCFYRYKMQLERLINFYNFSTIFEIFYHFSRKFSTDVHTYQST